MISYSTEFPIDNQASIEDVLALACEWITGSPHTQVPKNALTNITKSPEGTFSIDSESVVTGYASLPDYEIGGLRYTRLESDNIEWTTTIVTSQTPSQHLLSIQVSCEALKTASHLPHPKKPYFVKQVIERIGGGMDGQIPVSNKPINLSSGEEGIAADLIMGNAQNSLPIIYVSAGFDNSHIINPEKLAQWLSGMAHVVVEPTREFSLLVKDLTSSRNVYGGTVGVYWPDSIARKSYYFSEGNETAENLQAEISKDIRAALANRRQKTYCTWLHLKECISKIRYEQLKATGSTEIDEFIKAFDAEMAAKQGRIENAEQEIGRLNAELRKFTVGKTGREEGILSYGTEQDLYNHEIKKFVIDALCGYLNNTIEGTRKRHVLEDLIANNKVESDAEKISEEIKSIFKSYVDMDAKIKSTLTKLGFDISDDGKHYKLVFQGDGRYTFSVSKTSSDHRSGKNLTSDINRTLF